MAKESLERIVMKFTLTLIKFHSHTNLMRSQWNRCKHTVWFISRPTLAVVKEKELY